MSSFYIYITLEGVGIFLTNTGAYSTQTHARGKINTGAYSAQTRARGKVNTGAYSAQTHARGKVNLEDFPFPRKLLYHRLRT